MSYTSKSCHGGITNTAGGGSIAAPAAAYILANSLNTAGLTDYRVIAAGTGISIVDGGLLGSLTISATAPVAITDPTYLLLDNSGGAASYPNRRTIAAGAGISLVDGGAGNPLTVVNSNPTPFIDQTGASNQVWWDPVGGNDVDNPSTVTHNVLTYAAALLRQNSKMVNNNNRGVLILAPRSYPTTGGTLPILPNWQYLGQDPQITIFDNADTLTLDSIWSVGGDKRSVLSNFYWQGPVNLNFATVSSINGMLYAFNCIFNETVSLTAFNSNNGGTWTAIVLENGWTQTGMNMIWKNFTSTGNLTFNSRAGVPTIFNADNSTMLSGNININYTAGHGLMTLDFSHFDIRTAQITVTAIGVSAAASVTLIMPQNYTLNPIIVGTAGFCVIQNAGVTASALVSANGLSKASLFTSPPGLANQTLMNNGLGVLNWDFVRAWFLTVAGGNQVSLVTNPSAETVVGNVLQITSSGNAAFQPVPGAGTATYPNLTTTAPNVIVVADTNNLTPTGTYLNVISSAIVGTLKLRGVRHPGGVDAIVIKNDNNNKLLVYHNNTGQPALPAGSFGINVSSRLSSTVLLTGESATLIWNATTNLWEFNPYFSKLRTPITADQRKVSFTANISLAASTNNIKDFAGAYDVMAVDNPTQQISTSVGPTPLTADTGSFYVQYSDIEERFIIYEFSAGLINIGVLEANGVTYEIQIWRDGVYAATVCQFSSNMNNVGGRYPISGKQALNLGPESGTHTYSTHLVYSGGNGLAGKALNFQYVDMKFWMSGTGYFSV